MRRDPVTWAYQGRNSTETFGAHGQLQAIMGTGIVSGKLRGVQVDFIRHEWELIPGMLSRAPVNACTIGFLDAPGDPGTNWPSLIVRTLACGGYKMAGYADIAGAKTQWLPPTMANRAHASVTVPCGYQQISWPSRKPTSGEPGGTCG